MEDPNSASDDDPVLMDEDGEVEEREAMNFVFKATHEAKLRELLHKINSIEIKLCSDAAKEFIKLLKGESGGELLRLYVQSTSNFSELAGALKLQQGKPGMSYILSLISVILSHPDGKYKPNDKERMAISVALDKFARSFIEEKLDTIYKELNSKEGKRQKAALLLMASVVRRGSGLASDFAKKFDFKLQGFSNLAEYKKRQNNKGRKHSTRKSFVGFAMSFLEVGKPGLLRWVLQQREMYSGVLRGLEIDDDETVTYVLSTLRDRILTEQSLVPPGLRSVLFGSIVLEHLVAISGRENGGLSAELAHHVLLMVCTDPCNGLMPDFNRHPNPLRGNPKRLVELMKKLRATEAVYHRDLLLAIVRGRLSFASAYMEEFPYNLEDFASPSWFSMISLAANLVSSVVVGIPFDFLDSQSNDPPTFDSVDVQNIINIISSRPLSRSAINKGLLHSDFLVKNGTLRLFLEALRLLDSFFRAISLSCTRKQRMQKSAALKQEIWNEIQTLLPDPQVLLTLLSPLSSYARTNELCLKRTADKEDFLFSSKRTKKLKTNVMNEETHIIVGGISSVLDDVFPGDNENAVDSQISHASDSAVDFMNVMLELWGSDQCFVPVATLKDAEIFFQSKLLDAIKIYILTMPNALEGSFDFFVNLLSNPSELPSNLLCSLLSLLAEYVKWSLGSVIAIRTPPLMYKHLQPFLNLLIFSPVGDIKIQAYNLARAAIASTGAFDRNSHEIAVWFLFLPSCSVVKSSVQIHGTEVLQNLSTAVISFLCDAISTTGNNLFRYWDAVRKHTYHLNEFKDVSPEFSPLIVCVLQKCMRLLGSESGTFSLPEKSIISVYVSNTLKYLLQTQVDASLLAALIRSVLFEGLEDRCSVDFFCEWHPLQNLLLFAESILHQKTCCFFPIDQKEMPVDSSFARALVEVRKNIESGHDGEVAGIMKAFSSAIICTTSGGVLQNFPTVMTIFQHLRVPLPFLSSIIFLDQSFLAGVSKLWPKVFFPGLEKAVSMINPQREKYDTFAQEIMLNVDFDASESTAAVAFGIFLSQAPFHVLFPAIISSGGPCLSEPSKIKDVLMAKLSECTNDFVVSNLRLLLFWFYQIQLSYRIKPLAKLKELAAMCYILMKHMLTQLLVLKPNSEDPLSAEIIPEVVETIFCHPAVKASLTYPLDCDENSISEDFVEENFKDNLEAFLSFSQQRIHQIDHHVLDMLTTTFDYFLSPFSGQHYVLKVEDRASKRLVKAFRALIQRLYLQLKDKLDLFIKTEDLLSLLQPFYALHALIQFTSPFELFDLAHWIFDTIEVNGLTAQKSCRISAFSIGFCIAVDAFKNLSNYLQQPVTMRALFYTFWEMEEKNLNANLIEETYFKACKFATNFELDFAYTCLLEAVGAVYRQKYVQCDLLDPLSMLLSRVIMSTPLEILSRCVYGTSKTKAKLLFLLVDMSSLHLSVFGYLFLGILNKKFHPKEKIEEETCKMPLSDEEFLLLLPAALSYLNSVFMKLEKQYYKQFTNVPSFYSKILLCGFCNWRSFVSGYVFQENYDEFFPSSIEEIINLVDASLLGKAMHMLRFHFALSGDVKLKERLKMFSSVLTCSDAHDELLDCDVSEMEFYSLSQSLNLINRVVAKISFCRMLLFPVDNQILSLPKEADGNSKAISLEMVSKKEGKSRMHFIKILVSTWQCMVSKFPSVSYDSRGEKCADCLQLYRYLELFILKTILELTTEMRDGLVQLQAIPFLEQLMTSSLLYRFEDPTTLDSLCCILTMLSEGKFSSTLYLQLLLAHSQFMSTICSITESHSSQIGALFRPMPSILRSLVIPRPSIKNDLQATKHGLKQLEFFKLLGTLVQLKRDQTDCSSGTDIGINLKELHLLLLSSYGATLGEIDLVIYNIMHDIESIDKSVSEDLAQLDYLWGSAALKIRKERALDQDASNIMTDKEAFEEHRRNQFREILPIDPKLCLATVLHFPYNRIVSDRALSLNRFEPETLKNLHVTYSPAVDKIQLYDPIFILRFSIHVLSTGYIEPVEFAGLGLLAITFISMSSPGIGMRKFAYESLGRYKSALESCQKKKDGMRLQLLLTYMQNGIHEKWQKIPSVIALFAAESSLILLDPSNDHHSTLSKHLLHSSKVNMKKIPLFHTFFQSNSVNFRAERLWMLRLACAGLNLDDDAQIFKSDSILKILLSFYATPLADNESKELILQVVKKSVKLHRMTHHLVKHCGLLPWLSYMLPISCVMLDEKENSFSSLQLAVAIEVVSDIISSRDIIQWLQDDALEHLLEFSSHLYKLLVGGSKFIKENVSLINSVLQIMVSSLKISQKRKKYQPHYTLSFEGLFQIYGALDACDASRSSINAEFGLQAMLMSTPPVDIFDMNQEKLSGFLAWAVSTALTSDLKNSHFKRSQVSLMIVSKETPSEESLILKLLRWLVAAVILGKLSWKLNNDLNSEYLEISGSKSLQSFLDYVEKGYGGSYSYKFDCEEVLAVTIFYLQQLLHLNCPMLSSVVCALCLLLLCGPSEHSDFVHGYRTAVVSLSSKVLCATEANPKWRWTFYQPWRDLSSEMSDLQKMDEYHACQSILVIISNVLGKKPLDTQVLSHQDIEISNVFEWERTIVEPNNN